MDEPRVYRLLVTGGDGRSRAIALGPVPLVLGRHPGADVVLDDITVSLRHAQISMGPDGPVVADLGSLNGTWVNGWRVMEAQLRVGDEVALGRYHLLVVREQLARAG